VLSKREGKESDENHQSADNIKPNLQQNDQIIYKNSLPNSGPMPVSKPGDQPNNMPPPIHRSECKGSAKDQEVLVNKFLVQNAKGDEAHAGMKHSNDKSNPLYCGLSPSSVDFYPFIPIPSEVAMKGCQKIYPNIDRLNHLSLASNETQEGGLGKLQSHSQNASSKQMIVAQNALSQMKTQDLKKELTGVLSLLHRQQSFLEQSLANMEEWSKTNLSPGEYASSHETKFFDLNPSVGISGVTDIAHTGDKGCGMEEEKLEDTRVLGKGSNTNFKRDVIPPLTSSMTKTNVIEKDSSTYAVVAVKIRYEGMKDLKQNVFAHVDWHCHGHKSSNQIRVKGDECIPTSSSRKRKSVTSSFTKTFNKDFSEVLTSTKLKPSDKRKQLSALISRRVHLAEEKWQLKCKKRNAAMESILEELDDLAHIDDKDAALSPITLWAWLEDSTYINDIKKDDIGDLEVSWQPEIGRGENFWGEMPPVRMGQIGLFDRLQSLLVDENDNEEEDDREEEEKEWIDRIKQKRLKTGTDAALINPMDFMDVSDLSLNERAYIHLRAHHIIDRPFLLKHTPNVIENVVNSSNSESHMKLIQTLRQKKCELSELHRRGNMQAAWLQYRATQEIAEIGIRKKREDARSQQITKFSQLLAKKTKQDNQSKAGVLLKNAKKGDDWMPW